MIEFLVMRIKMGRLTLDQVPESIRTQVEAALDNES